jgi:hypothetical protein
MIEILSLGAGVQSSCILLMSCKGVLPKLDHAIFADTQWEPEPVYRQLEFLKGEAAKAGISVHIVSKGNLREHVLEAARTGKRVSSPPFFTMGCDGRASLINRSCTADFKIDPIERKCKEIVRTHLGLKPKSRLPTSQVVRQWIGISADETQRYKISQVPWFAFYHPLIDTLQYHREDCLAWMKDHGYPLAPRSACIGCPFHSNEEWRQIKRDPKQWADAVEFDRAVRGFAPNGPARLHGVDGAVFLHRSLLPLDQAPIDLDPQQQGIDWGMEQECAGICGV